MARAIPLGAFIGGAPYFGKCPDCGRQHMSTHALVFPRGHEAVCYLCGIEADTSQDLRQFRLDHGLPPE